MICEKCGREIDDQAVYCPYCGNEIKDNTTMDAFFEDKGDYWRNGTQLTEVKEKVGILWVVLAFVIPISGIIMYFIWKDSRPKTAKYCLIAGLVSIGINILTL